MDHAPSTLLLLLVVLAAFPALIAGRVARRVPPTSRCMTKRLSAGYRKLHPVRTLVRCEERDAPTTSTAKRPTEKKTISELDTAPDGIAFALTRRFGLAGGLAWLGFLTFGVVSEQVKTRTEVKAINEGAIQVDAPEVLLPSGLKVQDLRLGGGDAGCGILGRTSGEKGCGEPRRGDLVTIAFDGLLDDGTSFASQKREISFVYGNRPNEAAGISRGLLEGISTMTQGGVRQITVPADLGFGDKEVETASGVKIPAGSTLRYNVKLKRVSVAPS
mmetsp:Transcript_18724/g.26043  ORF Transcript_18724/g.26043 Transcript_18724/m.26043 type:complete len:274 (+) Transcript_18724:31-852(+)